MRPATSAAREMTGGRRRAIRGDARRQAGHVNPAALHQQMRTPWLGKQRPKERDVRNGVEIEGVLCWRTNERERRNVPWSGARKLHADATGWLAAAEPVA